MTPASQSHISHECSPLRWAISCKHEIAPLLISEKPMRSFTSVQMIHTHTLTDLVAYTHTHTHTHHSQTHRLGCRHTLWAHTHHSHTHRLGCRCLLRGIWCSARGRMCALASLGLRRSAGGFCVAGAALGAPRGVGCTPWRPLVSAALPVAFAWQVRRLVLCKRSGGRPGVPSSPPLCRWLFRGRCGASVGCTPWRPLVSAALPVALRGRCGTWCSARGRMYALASFGLRRSAGGFCVAGAALGALQGSDVRPGVPWSPPLCRWLLRGRCGTWCSARGRMYALASLGLRRSPVAFAWQVRHLVLCKRFDVHPGVPWSPPVCRWLLRGRCGTWCSASGRMYALASLSLRRSAGGFCVAGAALGALQAAALPVAFAWQVRHLEVGCTPLLVSFSLPVAFAWQVRRWVLRDEAE